MSDFLGFNPRDLGVFQAPQTQDEQSMVYKASPEKSVSEDGVYRSQIRVLYNVYDIRNSIIEKQSYALRDADGFFIVDSPLSVGDKNCPIFKAWKKLRYSGNERLEQLGNEIFQKQFSRWCLIQVIDDPNRPDLNGKYMFFKLPKFIWNLMQTKMNPSPETRKAPVPVMDFMRGTVIYLNVAPGPDDPAHPERKKREISYSTSEISSEIVPVTKEDGTSFISEEEQALIDKYIETEAAANKKRKPEEREAALAALAADPLTKEVAQIYNKVAEGLLEICPDLVKEMQFRYYDKESGMFWEPAVQTRVDSFCALAMQGQNPAKPVLMVNEVGVPEPVSVAPTTTQLSPQQAAQSVSQPAASKEDDDLPF